MNEVTRDMEDLEVVNVTERNMVERPNCGTFNETDMERISACGFWLEGVTMSILGISALITNCISIYVFSRKSMRNSFNSLIVVLTVIDSLLCVFLMTEFTFVRAFGLRTVIVTLLYPHFIYPMISLTLSASVYMTVVLGLERYIAVCFPIVHRDLVHTYSVSKRVMAYTIPVLILSILINIPKFFETKVVFETEEDFSVTEANVSKPFNKTIYYVTLTDLRDDPLYIKLYVNVARTVLLGLLPFATLIFFNVKIYTRFLMTRGRYSRPNNHNSSQAKDLQLALILIFVVCMFFVTNLPRLFLNLFELFNMNDMIACGERFFPGVWFVCASSVNHLLLVLNCIMNFVVYCWFNDGFKALMYSLLGKKFQRKNEDNATFSNNAASEIPMGTVGLLANEPGIASIKKSHPNSDQSSDEVHLKTVKVELVKARTANGHCISTTCAQDAICNVQISPVSRQCEETAPTSM